MLMTQKTPEERKEYLEDEIEEAVKKLQLLQTYAPNIEDLNRGKTGLRVGFANLFTLVLLAFLQNFVRPLLDKLKE